MVCTGRLIRWLICWHYGYITTRTWVTWLQSNNDANPETEGWEIKLMQVIKPYKQRIVWTLKSITLSSFYVFGHQNSGKIIDIDTGSAQTS